MLISMHEHFVEKYFSGRAQPACLNSFQKQVKRFIYEIINREVRKVNRKVRKIFFTLQSLRIFSLCSLRFNIFFLICL